jgi:hypothetical protein
MNRIGEHRLEVPRGTWLRRLERYGRRFREAGLVSSARIAGARAAGYLRWPMCAWSRARGGIPSPPLEPSTGGGETARRYVLLWEGGGLDERLEALRKAGGLATTVPLQVAEDYLEVGFAPLGWGPVSLVPPVAWHRDGATGATWPLEFHKGIDYVRSGQACDVKFPWELSRLQVLPRWAQAWQLTRDPRWFHACWRLLGDWVAQNPVGYGVNWTCSMEVAIRALNLLAMAELIERDLTAAHRACLESLFKGHLQHLKANLELSDVGGNHLWFDRLGIALLTRVLAGPESSAFRQAASLLAAEAEDQFHADGLHLEHATDYHRLVLDGLLLFLRATRGQRLPDRDRLETVGRRAARALQALALPDGTMPSIGDSDTGQVLLLGARGGNHAAASLELAASLGLVVHPQGGVWDPSLRAWLGTSPTPEMPRSATSGDGSPRLHAFPEGGLHVISTGDLHLVLRAGPPGLRGRGSHDHNDQLALWLAVKGHPLFIDPGTSTYTGSDARHAQDLATRSHNTLEVAGLEQAPVNLGSVSMTVRASEGKCASLGPTADGSITWEGEVAYGGPSTGFLHRRVVRVVPRGTGGGWEIQVEDKLLGGGTPGPDGSVGWTLAPGLVGQGEGSRDLYVDLPGFKVHMLGSAPLARTMTTASPRYGESLITERWSLPLDQGGHALAAFRILPADSPQ